MREQTTQVGGCRPEIQDCEELLKSQLSERDRAVVMQRLEYARSQLRQIEDEQLLSLLE